MAIKRPQKETPAQNKLQTELEETNDEPACYACIRERTGLSDEYKKRAEALTSKKDEVEKKKRALEKLTQDHPDVCNVLIYHKLSSCHGLSPYLYNKFCIMIRQ